MWPVLLYRGDFDESNPEDVTDRLCPMEGDFSLASCVTAEDGEIGTIVSNGANDIKFGIDLDDDSLTFESNVPGCSFTS